MSAGAVARGHSVLVVPVTPLEDWVRARHAHYDRAYVSADPTFAHAHVTLLAPFVAPEEIAAVRPRIAKIVAATPTFEFALEQVDTFPNGIVHLVPEPEEIFRELTAALWRAFPAYPPYAGRFPDVRPHVTLDALGPGVTTAAVAAWVAPLLPARGYADRVHLSWYESWGCRTLETWRLGEAERGSAGPRGMGDPPIRLSPG